MKEKIGGGEEWKLWKCQYGTHLEQILCTLVTDKVKLPKQIHLKDQEWHGMYGIDRGRK